MQGYHWTIDQIDSMHPYDILVALGWRPTGVKSHDESWVDQALERKRERDKKRKSSRPPLMTKDK